MWASHPQRTYRYGDVANIMFGTVTYYDAGGNPRFADNTGEGGGSFHDEPVLVFILL